MTSTNPPPSMWQRSLTRRFLAWLGRRRTLQGLFFLCASILTLIALIIAMYNWRSHRAWSAYRQQLVSQGESLNNVDFIPPAVPDKDNFAMTPFLAPLLDFEPKTADGRTVRRDTNAFQRANDFAKDISWSPHLTWTKGQPMDLAAWLKNHREKMDRLTKTNTMADLPPPTDQAQAAKAILEILQPCEPVLEELRTASRRPHARFNIRYDEENPWAILLPHLAVMKRAGAVTGLRANALLATGQPEKAFEDLLLICRLAESLKDEPILVSQLVRNAIWQVALQVAWEGMANQQWTAAQLETLQNQIANVRTVEAVARSLRAEQVFNINFLEMVRDRPERRFLLAGIQEETIPHKDGQSGSQRRGLLLRLMPRGWFNYELLSYAGMFHKLLGAADVKSGTIDPVLCESYTRDLETHNRSIPHVLWKHRIIVNLLMPALNQVYRKSASVQAFLSEASMACALARYRLDHGRYPESLEALAPKYLSAVPQDVITGQTFQYRLTEPGHYLIYSLGWDRQDENGKPVFQSKEATQLNTAKGDWPWRL